MRKIVAKGDGVALAEFADGDKDFLREQSDGAFQTDLDPRPMPYTMPNYGLAVTTEDGSELLGGVSWHPAIHGPTYGCVAWNFGRELLPRVRGKGIGTEVLRLLVRHLFDTTDVDRIEASTDVTNVRAQRSLEKAGFTREGIIRGAQQRAGKRHDLTSYSMLRTDLAAR